MKLCVLGRAIAMKECAQMQSTTLNTNGFHYAKLCWYLHTPKENKAWKQYYFYCISFTRFQNLCWDGLLQSNTTLSLRIIPCGTHYCPYFIQIGKRSWEKWSAHAVVARKRIDGTWPLTKNKCHLLKGLVTFPILTSWFINVSSTMTTLNIYLK